MIKAKRIKVRDQVNAKRLTTPPDIKIGDEILYQSGFDGKKPRVKGPSTIKKIISKDSFPKTLIIEDNGKDKAVSMKDALPFYQKSSNNKVCYLFLAALCLINAPQSNATFARESPILWIKSSSSVIDTVVNVNHTLIFRSMCDVFKPSKLITEIQSKHLRYWCLHETDRALMPLQQVCHDRQDNQLLKQDTGLTRKRRELVTLLAIGVFTIVANTAVTWYFISINREGLRDIERKFNIVQNENSRFESHLKNLTKDLGAVALRLDALEDQVDFLQQSFPHVSILIVDVNNEVNHFKQVGSQMLRNWRLGELVPSIIFDFLVPAVPNKFGIMMSQLKELPSNALLDESKAQSCSVNMNTKLLSLRYQVPLRKNDTAIHEALAFQIQKNFTDKNSQETMTCLMEYIGPKYVSSDSNCTRILNVPQNVIGKLQFLYDSSINCQAKPENKANFWKKMENTCVKASDANFPAQLFMTSSGAFVYCYGHELTIGNSKFRCPNYVIRVTLKQDFKVAGYFYSPKVHNLNYKNFSMSEHLRINEQVYPHAITDPILVDIKRLQKELDSEVMYQWEDYFYHPSMYVVMILGLVCLILVLLLYCCWKNRSSNQTIIVKTRRTNRPKPRGEFPMNNLEEPGEEGGFISD